MIPALLGANSDAAKLQHSVKGLRWKRVRNSGDCLAARLGSIGFPPGERGIRQKAVPKHVCIFLKTESLEDS